MARDGSVSTELLREKFVRFGGQDRCEENKGEIWLVHNERINYASTFFNNLSVAHWFESKLGVQPVTSPTHWTDRRHPPTGESPCGSHHRRNYRRLILNRS